MKKKEFRKMLCAGLIFVLFAGLLAACGSSADTGSQTSSGGQSAAATVEQSPAAEQSTAQAASTAAGGSSGKLMELSFGTSPWPTSMFAYLADSVGIFEKHGLKVKLNTFASFSDSLQAFIGGNLDVITSASSDTIAPFSQGADFKIIMLTDKSLGSDGMVTKPDIKKIEDLKGKTVATEFYSVDHMYLLSLLDKAGMSEKDINLTNMSIADAGTAFIAGRVDAAVVWEPYLSKALNDGKGNLLYSSKDDPDLITDSIAASKNALENKKEAVQAFTDSWYEAVQYWKDHQKESEEIMAKALEVSPEEFRSMMEKLYIAEAKDGLTAFEPSDGKSTFVDVNQKIAEFLKRLKVINNVPNVSDMIDTEFLKNTPTAK